MENGKLQIGGRATKSLSDEEIFLNALERKIYRVMYFRRGAGDVLASWITLEEADKIKAPDPMSGQLVLYVWCNSSWQRASWNTGKPTPLQPSEQDFYKWNG
jgi:hypothetical protein